MDAAGGSHPLSAKRSGGGGSCAAPTVLRLPYRVSLGANLFEGFEIWDTEGGKCCVYHRVFPIIYLSSSLIKRAMQLEMYAAFGELIATEFARHAYLEASGSLSGAEREYFSHMRVAKESMPRYTTSGVF